MSDSATPWATASQALLSFIISWSLLKLMSIELVMPSNNLIICYHLLLLLSITSGSKCYASNLPPGGDSTTHLPPDFLLSGPLGSFLEGKLLVISFKILKTVSYASLSPLGAGSKTYYRPYFINSDT